MATALSFRDADTRPRFSLKAVQHPEIRKRIADL